MARVFNVSHHKCGTTSVHRALEILGFQSHHWEIKSMELIHRHLDGTIEEEPFFQPDNSAFNDLPITLMYRELYRIFPTDKFIFVRRDRRAWVESLRRHLVKYWQVPLAVHTLVYGYPIKASNFDEAVCLRVYDRLCGDILEFFSGKPNFLLIEFEDLSWRSLCPFLGLPEPDQPFPWQNKTQRFKRGPDSDLKNLHMSTSDDIANWDPVGQWTSRYAPRVTKDRADDTGRNAINYGTAASYQLAAVFLEDCHNVEDWGCGFGTFKKYCLSQQYIGIDGSESPAADAVVDLSKYRSDVEGILVRHVLEHNPNGWRQILTNAIESFSKKMVLVIYTPFGDVTRNVRRQSPADICVPVAMSFRKSDLVSCIAPEISWFTVVGEPLSKHETMFFLHKGDERRASSSRQEVAYDPDFDGDL